MPPLLLTPEMQRAFIGALLMVCRVGGRVTPAELEGLRKVAHDIAPDLPIDDEWLLWSEVGPEDFAALVVQGNDAGAYRSSAISDPEKVAAAFVQAALRLGAADGLRTAEIVTIRKFGAALGLSGERMDELGATR
jgi:hypothetical protein